MKDKSKKSHPPITQIGRVPWSIVKEHFFAKNLDQTRKRKYTHRELADAFNIPWQSVRRRAMREKWGPELEQRLEELATQKAEDTQKAAREDAATMRERQAKVAKSFYAVASTSLARLAAKMKDDPDFMLEPSDVERFARLGLIQERKAMGVPDIVEQEQPEADDVEWEPPLMNAKRHQKSVKNANTLLRLMEEMDAEDEQT